MSGDNVTLIQGEAELKTEMLKVSYKIDWAESEMKDMKKFFQFLQDVMLKDDIRKGFIKPYEYEYCEKTFPTILSIISATEMELDDLKRKKTWFDSLSSETKIGILEQHPNFSKNLEDMVDATITDSFSFVQVAVGSLMGKLGLSASREGQLIKALTSQRQYVESKDTTDQKKQEPKENENLMDKFSR
jgi:hypothetical protein